MQGIMINIIAIVLSISSITIGFLKLFIGFESYTISIGNNYITIPNSTSIYYIFLVNFIGGVCVLYHSYKTVKYRNKSIIILSKLSKFEILTGIYSMIIALILLVKLFVLLAGFGNNLTNYFILFLIVICIQGVYPLLIIVLVFKNFRNSF